MKMYTKTGDGGETGLIGGARVRKDDGLMELLGGLDELNSALGLSLALNPYSSVAARLQSVQSLLFEAGAEVANQAEERSWTNDIEGLEREIDAMTAALPPLRHFILPGGSPEAANLHLARSICRRAERSLVRNDYNQGNHPALLAFLNRLSDWLFCAARLANQEAGVEDVRWMKQ